jgi:CheY-like chemotaxis protein
MGFEVVSARNGLEGLKMMKQLRPDLVLLDITMPDMDGYEVLEHSRKDLGLAKIPIVMLTVDASMEIRARCVSLGCAGYLVKPVTIEELYHILYDFLSYPGGKRQFLRATIHERVKVTIGETTHQLTAITLSEGGIYVRMMDPPPVGSSLSIELSVYDKQMKIDGSVIYVRDTQSGFTVDPGMAVRFEPLREDDAFVLRHFISERLAGDLIQEQGGQVLRLRVEEE